jgi:hypothetical protein
MQYTAYVVAMSLMSSLLVSLAAAGFTSGGRSAEPRDAMMVLSMALTMLPYAVLQVVVAALVLKPLSLWRLFVVSVAFLLGGVLLIVAASRAPWSMVRYLAFSLYSIAFGNFSLLIPVLILALIGRHRFGRSSAMISAAPDDVSLAEPRNVAVPESKWRWYHWDMAIAAVILWFEIILDPWGVFSYLGGLINVPFSHIALLMCVMVVPVALLCPLILLARMLVVWPRRLHSWRRLLTAWGMSAGVFLIGFILPFLLPIARPWDAFMAGFQQHVRWRVDIPAVQEWLAALKPAPLRPGQARPDLAVEERDLPPSIVRLRAWVWRIDFDDASRPSIRLMWGSGVMGGWGLVVGNIDMETPPSDFSRYGEIRQAIAPGAYVWYDVK